MDLDSERDLLELLTALDGVAQPVRYHPEGDALFHSLQVFEHARAATDDPELWAAALFHDVGKALDGANSHTHVPPSADPWEHDEIGADLLEGLVSDRVVFLVRHHLDLLRDPRRTRRRLHGTRELEDLERLRRWDLAGRRVHASVPSPRAALAALHQHAERNARRL